MPQENEIRSLVRPIEVRADGDEQGSVAAGYAAIFNSRTEIGDWFTEVIAPGAFAESLKTADVRALFDHDSAKVLGRSSAGTLRVSEDDIGLAVEIDLPDTSTGRDVRELLKRGDISGMSFGFRVQKQEWDDTVEPPLRTITQMELIEVSVVTFPAYGDTSIALRSLEHAKAAAKPQHPAHRRVSARRAAMEQKIRGF